MAGTSSVAPAGHGCREPHPGCAWLRPYRASILTPLAHPGRRAPLAFFAHKLSEHTTPLLVVDPRYERLTVSSVPSRHGINTSVIRKWMMLYQELHHLPQWLPTGYCSDRRC